MAHYYLDSSALVKRYVAEPGSDWIQELCQDASNTIYSARISGAEIVAAFFLRARTGSLSLEKAHEAASQFRIVFQTEYDLVEVTEQVVEHAMDLVAAHGLRGYDSVQLGAALVLQAVRFSLALAPVVFVSADKRLNEAARAEGMLVENPNTHA